MNFECGLAIDILKSHHDLIYFRHILDLVFEILDNVSLHSEATLGVMHLCEKISFWQIPKILRYQKPYFPSYIIEIVNFQPPILAHFCPLFLNKCNSLLLRHH